jgi:hypothetical protein
MRRVGSTACGRYRRNSPSLLPCSMSSSHWLPMASGDPPALGAFCCAVSACNSMPRAAHAWHAHARAAPRCICCASAIEVSTGSMLGDVLAYRAASHGRSSWLVPTRRKRSLDRVYVCGQSIESNTRSGRMLSAMRSGRHRSVRCRGDDRVDVPAVSRMVSARAECTRTRLRATVQCDTTQSDDLDRGVNDLEPRRPRSPLSPPNAMPHISSMRP